ncbi:uncharacterized protein LOC132731824 isoform X2 [Ruditapes philippinarum]|nr:uncharacterized protein LOC132731824 isoform X2 [Ruditapes philippinarum]
MSGIQELERDNRRTVTDPHGCHGMVVADSGSRNALQSSYHGTTTVETNDESKLNLERKCVPLKFETSSWCDERKRELQSTEDERPLRDFLCRAISKNARMIAVDLDVSNLLDHLLSKYCITEDEYNELRSLDKSKNLARTVLGLVLRRDCRTLLSFIDIIFECGEHIASSITVAYDSIVNNADSSRAETGRSCSHCLLLERTEPILIIDSLISHDYEMFLPFYEQVANCRDNVPEKRKEWWDNFMTHVMKVEASAEMTQLIIEALEECRFHSDIIRNLREDQSKNVNSFLCTHICSVVLNSSPRAEDEEHGPRMQELKVDYENTNLRMFQRTTISSKVNVKKMHHLKSFDLENLPDDQRHAANRFMYRYTHKSSRSTEENINEPRMEELKEFDYENTNLKMIQNATGSSTVTANDMQELIPFESGSGDRMGHRFDDSRNRQGGENANTREGDHNELTQLTLIFVFW